MTVKFSVQCQHTLAVQHHAEQSMLLHNVRWPIEVERTAHIPH